MPCVSEIRTARLVLRPPPEADAPRIAELAAVADVARMTGRPPHPYQLTDARDWLSYLSSTQPEVAFAITMSGDLVRVCGYNLTTDGKSAEIGYWQGEPFWAQGLATAAAKTLIRYGFTQNALDRVTVSHMTDNPASAAVIAKLGFHGTGRGLCSSLARGAEVEANRYALTRSQAEALPWYQAA